MIELPKVRNSAGILFAFACCAVAVSGQVGPGRVTQRPAVQSAITAGAIAAPQDGPSLVIENDSALPDTSPHTPYEVRFRGRGGAGAQHWRLEKGALPPGMKLEDDGLLHGQAEHAGEFQFTIAISDSRRAESAVQKGFTLRVRSALSIDWKTAAHVTGSRIDGSIEVSNATSDDMDLTFYVLAVAENGRATAIGYQRFTLRRGSTSMDLPFGETLAHGGYVVHVDVVGEVAAKNLIYREHLQTPGALQVLVGP